MQGGAVRVIRRAPAINHSQTILLVLIFLMPIYSPVTNVSADTRVSADDFQILEEMTDVLSQREDVISSELVNNRNDIDMIRKILKWSDYIVVLTTEENLSLRNSGLERKMPADWTFFKNDPFERYKKAGLFQEDFSEINVYGQVVR